MPKCYRCKEEKSPSEFMKKIADYSKMTFILMGVCIKCHKMPREKSIEKTLKDRISMQNRRAKAEGLQGDLTLEQWQGKLSQSEGPCFYCKKHVGIISLVIEHLVPIKRGGHTTIENVVPACKLCNSQKTNKTAEEWSKSK